MPYLGETFTNEDGTTTTVGGDPTVDYAMPTISPSVDYGAPAIPSESPIPDPADPCRDCPGKILYRTILKEVRVPVAVPGPTQFVDRIVYINSQTGEQTYNPSGGASAPFYDSPGFQVPSNGIQNGIENDEPSITPEGGVQELSTGKSSLLWLALIGAGIFLMKR